MSDAYTEQALVFDCEGESLVGVLSVPAEPASRGVLIVVGGPQYRVGSHRQFTLLARHLGANGIPTLRFDYRGMGDSTGDARNFEAAGEDIGRAIDVFFERVPALTELVIWGLCDAASAAILYAYRDDRVRGLILLNPWVRTAHGIARVQLKHYYGARLFQVSFWDKLVRGDLNLLASARSLASSLTGALILRRANSSSPLPERMRDGLQRFKGRTLLILSGKDLTAQEFKDVVASSAQWQTLVQRGPIVRCDIDEADHTFSRRAWRDQVASWTAAWVRELPSR